MATKCKHGDTACGVYWTCGKCAYEENRAAWNRLTPAEKAYDNYVDPIGAYHMNYDREPEGCSCHINPPCQWCMSQDGEG